MHELVEPPGDIQLHPVGQMAAVCQIQPQHRVPRLEDGQIDGHVGLRPRVRLDVDMLRSKQLLGPLTGQILDDIDVFAATVIAASRVAFGVFVGQHGAHGLQHGGTGVVFAGDHLQTVALTVDLRLDRRPNLGILLLHQIHDGHSHTRGFALARRPSPAATAQCSSKVIDSWPRPRRRQSVEVGSRGSIETVSWPRLSLRLPARSLICRNRTPVF